MPARISRYLGGGVSGVKRRAPAPSEQLRRPHTGRTRHVLASTLDLATVTGIVARMILDGARRRSRVPQEPDSDFAVFAAQEIAVEHHRLADARVLSCAICGDAAVPAAMAFPGGDMDCMQCAQYRDDYWAGHGGRSRSWNRDDAVS